LVISVVKSLKESKQNISIVIPSKKMENISKLINPLILPNKIPMIVKPKEYKR
jgi:transcriptional regulator